MIVLLFQTMDIYRFENGDGLKWLGGLAVWSGMPGIVVLIFCFPSSSSYNIQIHMVHI